MSIANQIDRLNGVKTDIKAAIIDKGVGVPVGSKLDACPALIRAIAGPGGTPSIAVLTMENATLTVTSSEGSKTFPTGPNGVVVVPAKIGVTYTLKATEGEDYSETGTVAVTADTHYFCDIPYHVRTLNDTSWSKIRQMSDDGTAENFFSVGDWKEVKLNGKLYDGGSDLSIAPVYAFIIGFNHNAEYEGPNRIHFQLGKPDPTQSRLGVYYGGKGRSRIIWNQDNTRVSDGPIYRNVLGKELPGEAFTLLATFPDDLKAVLKKTVKYTYWYQSSSKKDEPTERYIHVLSSRELSDSSSTVSSVTHDVGYAYYLAGNPTIAQDFATSAGDTPQVYWTRTKSGERGYHFAYVDAEGTSSGGHPGQNDYSFSAVFFV